MAQVQSIDFQQVIAFTLPTNVETIVVTGQAASVESPTVKVVVKAFLMLIAGTSTTNVIVNIYRGTAIVAGNRIYQQGYSGGFTPGTGSEFVAAVSDLLANAGGAQYCVSVQQGGATANGTVQTGSIETMVLSG